jgi:competence ComEA-like helix-hairpin-helix protein
VRQGISLVNKDIDMEMKSSLKHVLLALSLITASAPGWCVKDTAATVTPKAASAAKTVNINSADAATISEVLKGVGSAKADAIVAYRKEHGPFKSAEQLAEVKGIGDKLVVVNHDKIVVK